MTDADQKPYVEEQVHRFESLLALSRDGASMTAEDFAWHVRNEPGFLSWLTEQGIVA